jgi:hypothetical protein
MGRPLAHSSQNEESKHNLEILAETEFSYLLRSTDGKQRLLSLNFQTQSHKKGQYKPDHIIK